MPLFLQAAPSVLSSASIGRKGGRGGFLFFREIWGARRGQSGPDGAGRNREKRGREIFFLKCSFSAQRFVCVEVARRREGLRRTC